MKPQRDLFLVSFLILFFELAAIRWFGATVVFLTFFTNIVLLATFLGMSVGLLTARRPRDLSRTVLPLALLAFAAAVAINLAYWEWAEQFTVTVGHRPFRAWSATTWCAASRIAERPFSGSTPAWAARPVIVTW